MTKILDRTAFNEVKEYIQMQVMELRYIDNISEATEIEIKASLKAYLKLKELLDYLMSFEDDNTSSDKDKYN
jgi:hypothetical protein